MDGIHKPAIIGNFIDVVSGVKRKEVPGLIKKI
jgi:hypothetical protein